MTANAKRRIPYCNVWCKGCSKWISADGKGHFHIHPVPEIIYNPRHPITIRIR